MKKVVVLIGCLLLFGCNVTDKRHYETGKVPQQKSGLGMTYTGQIGYEVAPGLIMPFDGQGGIQPGFGF